MKRMILGAVALVFAVGVLAGPAAAEDKVKSKFYDFGEMLIDGEIKKPTALYTDARAKVKFDRLLKLKKSFMPALMDSSKDQIFK
ncbi:MAG: hypothetical protein FJ098_04955 [Deltaproteobacteria bacterium]|nr:hypothetical protein [Deltaproteobacteria bacterium]